MNILVNLVFEDAISEYIMIKLLNSFDTKFIIGTSYHCHGFGRIKTNINGYNEAAIAMPFFILTDMDNYPCPIDLINEWLTKKQSPNMIFRIAVKEVEAWLLADKEAFANFTGVNKVNIPDNPELEPDPKQKLISIVKRSRKRVLKDDIIPINDFAKIGPNYNERLMQYVDECWDLNRAIENAPSLAPAYASLHRFQYTMPAY